MASAVPLNPSLDLLDDAAARRELRRVLATEGLGVGIVEPFMLDEAPDWPMLQRMAELTAELGGTVNALGFDPEPGRLQASVRRLAEVARAAGAPMTLEAYPLSAVRTQAEALGLAIEAGPHAGLCVDTLHVIRAGGDWSAVAALPPECVRHVQINDGPRSAPPDRYDEAVHARLPPGEGEFDLPALIPLVPSRATLAVEAPFRAPLGATARDRVGRLRAAITTLLA